MGEIQRKSNMKIKYGLTLEDYDNMLAEQGGTCAICGKTDNRRLCVDHDHATGTVRALLCTACNTALHVFENKELRTKLESYLTDFGSR